MGPAGKILGLVIQEDAQKEAITGVVVSVGPYCQTWKIGDRLMFSRFAGHTLEVSKTESFIMMRESEERWGCCGRGMRSHEQ